jgi:predicted DNA-binding transcriptional regulator YafY
VDKGKGRLRWGTEQRLEFIEFRAFWEGGVRRADITSQFGVSVPQASNDLAQYQKLAPANLRYDSSEKRYVPTLDFKPRFMMPNADRYLVQLQAIADSVISLGDTWITDAPNVGVMPVPERRIDPIIFKRLVATIRGQRSVEVHFQSMNANRPEAIWRRISPHAFANDGLRWHVRAFCHIDRRFKDFILSRCRDLRGEGEAGAKAADDGQWSSIFDVVLKPNPQLTESQQQTIAMDYDMRDGRAIVPVRQALLYYFEKRLRLDLDPKRDSAAERPVVIANKAEFDKSRDAAK